MSCPTRLLPAPPPPHVLLTRFAPLRLQVATVPYDRRFPGNNQARACYTRYNEFYKCIAEKDPNSADCKFYAKAYRSLCPSEWVRDLNP